MQVYFLNYLPQTQLKNTSSGKKKIRVIETRHLVPKTPHL